MVCLSGLELYFRLVPMTDWNIVHKLSPSYLRKLACVSRFWKREAFWFKPKSKVDLDPIFQTF